MHYLLYLFGFLPSIIWLIFYLKKDKHPEPNKMILKVFALGMCAAFLAVLCQLLLSEAIFALTTSIALIFFLNIFIGAGLMEEAMKYLSARFGALRNAEMDEPADIILYLIISGLGFAAVENILYLRQQVLHPEILADLARYSAWLPARATLEFLGWRFVSATFLHALCAGALGYFIALSFYYGKKRKFYFFTGIGFAAGLHGLYDWSIMMAGSPWNFLTPILILITLGCFVSYGFKKVQKMQSACLIKR